MKIAVWNLMRPNARTVERNQFFIDELNKIDADILILTETNTLIKFDDKYFSISTESLPKSINEINYEDGENRVTILSKYPFVKQYKTYDSFTSVCGEIETPFGKFIIYGTIIGFLGGRIAPFQSDFENQILDLKNLLRKSNVCFAGDLNISFSGIPYPSKVVVNNTSQIFESLSLTNLTKDIENSAIHAILSKDYLINKKYNVEQKLFDKKNTDHNLIIIEIIE